MAGCYKFLGARILCSCSCQHRSGHNTPVSLQQDKCSAFVLHFFPLCSAIFHFISMKQVIHLKIKPEGQNCENGLSNAFQAISSAFLYKGVEPAWLKHQWQSTKVRAKGSSMKSVLFFSITFSLNGQVQPFTNDLLNYLYHIKYPHICNSVSVLLILIFWSKDLNLG